jgi:glycosyltransferase involved in cell wall biosynthesis
VAPGWGGSFAPVPQRGYDLVHTWNSVPVLTRRPYLITFESFMPRLPDNLDYGRARPVVTQLEKRLARRVRGDQCVALLALSQYATRQFAVQHADDPHRAALERKMEVCYPAVSLRRQEPKRFEGEELKLLFVGYEALRKGLPALLRAHGRLKAQGIPVTTTVVSSLQWSTEDYIGPSDESYVKRELEGLSQDGVRHLRLVPNDEVFGLMQEAHYFCFPTLHDTFGFVTVEALSCGTPVIASATCALPEVVEHGRCGYLLPFENDAAAGRWPWIYRRREPEYQGAYEAAVERLGDALYETLAEAYERRGSYEEQSAAALDRVRERFDRERIRPRLEQLYERCR